MSERASNFDGHLRLGNYEVAKHTNTHTHIQAPTHPHTHTHARTQNILYYTHTHVVCSIYATQQRRTEQIRVEQKNSFYQLPAVYTVCYIIPILTLTVLLDFRFDTVNYNDDDDLSVMSMLCGGGWVDRS